MMVDESPKVTVDTHHPTGTAEVSISIWLGEDERKGLIDRVLSRQTLLHDRERVIDALRMVDEEPHNPPSTEASEPSQGHDWEVVLK